MQLLYDNKFCSICERDADNSMAVAEHTIILGKRKLKVCAGRFAKEKRKKKKITGKQFQFGKSFIVMKAPKFFPF